MNRFEHLFSELLAHTCRVLLLVADQIGCLRVKVQVRFVTQGDAS
jgi:hypothetical protein